MVSGCCLDVDVVIGFLVVVGARVVVVVACVVLVVSCSVVVTVVLSTVGEVLTTWVAEVVVVVVVVVVSAGAPQWVQDSTIAIAHTSAPMIYPVFFTIRPPFLVGTLYHSPHQNARDLKRE